MAKTFSYVRVSGVKKLVKEKGRRSGVDFLEALDNYVRYVVERACAVETGKKTLDDTYLSDIEMREETETTSDGTVTKPVEETEEE